MKEIKTSDNLNIKILNTEENKVLVEENCCTALTITLNKNGDVFTSFLGVYNDEILKTLKKVQKTYYKNLVTKLKKMETEQPENSNKQLNDSEKITK